MQAFLDILYLFWTFFKIGITTFGGGYAMIPILESEVVGNGWMTSIEVMNFIAVAESTPGPVAINMATFVGSYQGGSILGGLGVFGQFIGAFVATLGVVLPSFIVILLIVAVFKKFLNYGVVKGFLNGVRPVVVGLITFTGIKMFLQVIFAFTTVNNASAFAFDWRALVILALIVGTAVGYKLIFKKKISAIILILLSAGLGMIMYGVLGFV